MTAETTMREALEKCDKAIAEFHRYYTGGEGRGSYDGKPEREGLWRAWYGARLALAAATTRENAPDAGGWTKTELYDGFTQACLDRGKVPSLASTAFRLGAEWAASRAATARPAGAEELAEVGELDEEALKCARRAYDNEGTLSAAIRAYLAAEPVTSGKLRVGQRVEYTPYGVQVEIVENDEGWWKIRCSDDSTAVVRPSHLAPTRDASDGEGEA